MTEWFARGGVPTAFAPTLAAMDMAIAQGAEDRTTQEVFNSIGRAPGSFEAYANRTAAVWMTPA